MNNLRFKYVGDHIIQDTIQKDIFYKVIKMIDKKTIRIPYTKMYREEPPKCVLNLCDKNGNILSENIINIYFRDISFKEE